MTRATVLGISGSPRRGANTTIMVRQALEAAGSVEGVETRLYEFAGKRIKPCRDCGKCEETGLCIIRDDLEGFLSEYRAADGVIWGTPVYIMSIPASMKAAIDRMLNSEVSYILSHDLTPLRPTKVCGTLAVGYHRNGGEELTLSSLINTSLVSGNVVVSGDATTGAYIGGACWSGLVEGESNRDAVLRDEVGLKTVRSVGQRVAELTLVVVAGRTTLGDRLPPEYSISAARPVPAAPDVPQRED